MIFLVNAAALPLLGTFPLLRGEHTLNRRPTIIDVAKQAGVSITTVSRVISNNGGSVREATSQRVHAAIKTLGYTHNAVASSLRTDLLLSLPDITNHCWPAVARGVQDRMEVENYAAVFANNDWDPQREKMFIESASRNRFDTILINPVSIKNADLKVIFPRKNSSRFSAANCRRSARQ